MLFKYLSNNLNQMFLEKCAALTFQSCFSYSQQILTLSEELYLQP